MMTPEGAILDWGALYMRQELGASPALSGLAFGAFSAAMATMRFLGDLVRDRFGAVGHSAFHRFWRSWAWAWPELAPSRLGQ
jgi:hypothetical protein